MTIELNEQQVDYLIWVLNWERDNEDPSGTSKVVIQQILDKLKE